MVAGIDFSTLGVRQSVDKPFTKLIDDVDDTGNTCYVGMADPGNSGNGALAVWQIQKITKNAYVTTIAYADGNVLFDNVWNNRASLSYS